MGITNDITTVEQLSEANVEETTLRDNPAILVTFPSAPRVRAFFVDDPGDSYWAPRLVCGYSQADLDIYLSAGQGGYGSDDILRGSDGTIFVVNINDEMLSAKNDRLSDFTFDPETPENFSSISEAAMEISMDPVSIAWDGERFLDAMNIIIRAVQGTKIGAEFLQKHSKPLTSRSNYRELMGLDNEDNDMETLEQAVEFLTQVRNGTAALVPNPDPNFLELVQVQSNDLARDLRFTISALNDDEIDSKVLQNRLTAARSVLALKDDA